MSYSAFSNPSNLTGDRVIQASVFPLSQACYSSLKDPLPAGAKPAREQVFQFYSPN
jgi:hypothetical protein